jgi:hypothetical protein
LPDFRALKSGQDYNNDKKKATDEIDPGEGIDPGSESQNHHIPSFG